MRVRASVKENILQKYSLWIAILLHLLFFLGVSTIWVVNSRSEKIPDLIIPSYAYHEDSSTASEKKVVYNQSKPEILSKNGIEKPVFNTRQIRFNHMVDISPAKSSEPVHLIGDDKKTPKPLIISLGKALTAKLEYPKAAIDLTIKGESIIGFLLHPDGLVTDVRLLKSSRADILDQAALSAAREISPVKNVNQYINEPTPIVFGIIFGSK